MVVAVAMLAIMVVAASAAFYRLWRHRCRHDWRLLKTGIVEFVGFGFGRPDDGFVKVIQCATCGKRQAHLYRSGEFLKDVDVDYAIEMCRRQDEALQ